MKVKERESCSVMSNSLGPHGLQPARLLCPWNSPGQNTEVGTWSLLQRIFPTQGLNQDLLHCRQILYQLSYQGIRNEKSGKKERKISGPVRSIRPNMAEKEMKKQVEVISNKLKTRRKREGNTRGKSKRKHQGKKKKTRLKFLFCRQRVLEKIISDIPIPEK